MAIKRGHRFPVDHADVFPKGLLLLGPISPDMEYERPNVQKTDPVTEVTFLAPVQPIPATPELLSGSGIRNIELDGLTAEARRMGQGEFTYVGFVYRATGIKGDTNSPPFGSKSSTAVRSEPAKVTS
jgi:hypothetical protein